MQFTKPDDKPFMNSSKNTIQLGDYDVIDSA